MSVLSTPTHKFTHSRQKTNFSLPSIDAVTVSIHPIPASGAVLTLGSGAHANFGPSGPTYVDFVSYGGTNGDRYNPSGCNVTSAHSQIQCNAAVGVGKDLVFQVRIGGQTSLKFVSALRYERPTITSIVITNGNKTIL